MKTKEYFEFFGMPITFGIDKKELKKQFLKNSRRFHPDFHTTSSAEEQAEMLSLSTFNNEAYQTLREDDLRLKYILSHFGLLGNEATQALPPMFLMNMMELNEAIMDSKMAENQDDLDRLNKKIKSFEDEISLEVEGIIESKSPIVTKDDRLEKVKNYYLKKRYLRRIKQNISDDSPEV